MKIWMNWWWWWKQKWKSFERKSMRKNECQIFAIEINRKNLKLEFHAFLKFWKHKNQKKKMKIEMKKVKNEVWKNGKVKIINGHYKKWKFKVKTWKLKKKKMGGMKMKNDKVWK